MATMGGNFATNLMMQDSRLHDGQTPFWNPAVAKRTKVRSNGDKANGATLHI
jgi:hypothetical protein